MLILSANHSLRPARRATGDPTAACGRRLHVGRRYGVGSNDWYVVPNGSSHGVLKVRRGVIVEVGIATKALTASRAADRRFFRNLRDG